MCGTLLSSPLLHVFRRSSNGDVPRTATGDDGFFGSQIKNVISFRSIICKPSVRPSVISICPGSLGLIEPRRGGGFVTGSPQNLLTGAACPKLLIRYCLRYTSRRPAPSAPPPAPRPRADENKVMRRVKRSKIGGFNARLPGTFGDSDIWGRGTFGN